MLIIQRPNPTQRTPLSGKWSAALIVVCLAVSAILIPVAAHLPGWVEFELVLGAWWIVWVIALSWILFQAHVVEHDARMPGSGRSGCLTDIWPFGDLVMETGGCLFGAGGCGEAFLVVSAACALLIGLVFVVELLIPGIAFILYLAVRGMLARVTNSHRNCEDKPARALLWGAIWATAYTAPIALSVWGVHALSRKPM